MAASPTVGFAGSVDGAGVKVADGDLFEGSASEDAASDDSDGEKLVDSVIIAKLTSVIISPTIG